MVRGERATTTIYSQPRSESRRCHSTGRGSRLFRKQKHLLRQLGSSSANLNRNGRRCLALTNLLVHLSKFNVNTDRRHDRRALTPDEFERLTRSRRAQRRVAHEPRSPMLCATDWATTTGCRATHRLAGSLVGSCRWCNTAGRAMETHTGRGHLLSTATEPRRLGLVDPSTRAALYRGAEFCARRS